MSIKRAVWATVLLASALAVSSSHAGLLSSPVSGVTMGFDGLIVDPLQPNGPVEVGGGTGYSVLASSIGGNLSLGEAPVGSWGLGSNGEWSVGKTFAGVDAGVDAFTGAPAIVFDFGAQGWGKVSAFLNYDPDFLTFGIPEVISLAAYDNNGDLIEEWFLPVIATPDGLNEGEYWGIAVTDTQPLIHKLAIYGPYVVADELTVAPVPEPSTYALMLAGLGLIGTLALRRRR